VRISSSVPQVLLSPQTRTTLRRLNPVLVS
jgi:hypothetical protein